MVMQGLLIKYVPDIAFIVSNLPLSTLAASAMPVVTVFLQGSFIEDKVDAVKAELHCTKLDVQVLGQKVGMLNNNVLSAVVAMKAMSEGTGKIGLMDYIC